MHRWLALALLLARPAGGNVALPAGWVAPGLGACTAAPLDPSQSGPPYSGVNLDPNIAEGVGYGGTGNTCNFGGNNPLSGMPQLYKDGYLLAVSQDLYHGRHVPQDNADWEVACTPENTTYADADQGKNMCGQSCGECLLVTGPAGSAVFMVNEIADYAAVGQNGLGINLHLNKSHSSMVRRWDGVSKDIQYKVVPCPTSGSIRVRVWGYFSTVSAFFVVYNHRVGLRAVHSRGGIGGDRAWVPLVRDWTNRWRWEANCQYGCATCPAYQCNASAGTVWRGGPGRLFDLRLTSATGEQVICANLSAVNITAGSDFECLYAGTGQQFTSPTDDLVSCNGTAPKNRGYYQETTWAVDSNSLVLWHNILRCVHGVPPVAWDPTIAANAAIWAQTCSGAHSTNLQALGYGENLFAATYVAYPEEVVQAWYDEVSQFNFSIAALQSGTGHFTQVVWKATTRIGCAACQRADSGWLWRWVVCEYAPAGNYINQVAGNVVPNVTTEDQCRAQLNPSPSPSDCGDSPPGWKDSRGNPCSTYTNKHWCLSDGTYGEGWDPSWGAFRNYSTNGLGPGDACCACGGGAHGSFSPSSSPRSSSPSPSRSPSQSPSPSKSSSPAGPSLSSSPFPSPSPSTSAPASGSPSPAPLPPASQSPSLSPFSSASSQPSPPASPSPSAPPISSPAQTVSAFSSSDSPSPLLTSPASASASPSLPALPPSGSPAASFDPGVPSSSSSSLSPAADSSPPPPASATGSPSPAATSNGSPLAPAPSTPPASLAVSLSPAAENISPVSLLAAGSPASSSDASGSSSGSSSPKASPLPSDSPASLASSSPFLASPSPNSASLAAPNPSASPTGPQSLSPLDTASPASLVSRSPSADPSADPSAGPSPTPATRASAGASASLPTPPSPLPSAWPASPTSGSPSAGAASAGASPSPNLSPVASPSPESPSPFPNPSGSPIPSLSPLASTSPVGLVNVNGSPFASPSLSPPVSPSPTPASPALLSSNSPTNAQSPTTSPVASWSASALPSPNPSPQVSPSPLASPVSSVSPPDSSHSSSSSPPPTPPVSVAASPSALPTSPVPVSGSPSAFPPAPSASAAASPGPGPGPASSASVSPAGPPAVPSAPPNATPQPPPTPSPAPIWSPPAPGPPSPVPSPVPPASPQSGAASSPAAASSGSPVPLPTAVSPSPLAGSPGFGSSPALPTQSASVPPTLASSPGGPSPSPRPSPSPSPKVNVTNSTLSIFAMDTQRQRYGTINASSFGAVSDLSLSQRQALSTAINASGSQKYTYADAYIAYLDVATTSQFDATVSGLSVSVSVASWGGSDVKQAVLIGYHTDNAVVRHLGVLTDSNWTLQVLLQIDRLTSGGQLANNQSMVFDVALPNMGVMARLFSTGQPDGETLAADAWTSSGSQTRRLTIPHTSVLAIYTQLNATATTAAGAGSDGALFGLLALLALVPLVGLGALCLIRRRRVSADAPPPSAFAAVHLPAEPKLPDPGSSGSSVERPAGGAAAFGVSRPPADVRQPAALQPNAGLAALPTTSPPASPPPPPDPSAGRRPSQDYGLPSPAAGRHVQFTAAFPAAGDRQFSEFSLPGDGVGTTGRPPSLISLHPQSSFLSPFLLARRPSHEEDEFVPVPPIPMPVRYEAGLDSIPYADRASTMFETEDAQSCDGSIPEPVAIPAEAAVGGPPADLAASLVPPRARTYSSAGGRFSIAPEHPAAPGRMAQLPSVLYAANPELIVD